MKNSSELTAELNPHLSYIQRFGAFPDDARKAKYLECLQTPMNYRHFTEICKKFPPVLPEHTLDKETTSIVGCLSSHYPDLRIQWLPGIIYPFVKLFPKDALTQFEISLTYLTNWCSLWFCDYPAPSTPILTLFSSNLPQLSTHLHSLNHTLGSLLWPMFLVTFTDVFNKSDWLKVFDYVFVQPDRPWLLLAILIELVRHLEPELIAAKSLEKMHAVLRRERKGHIAAILRCAEELARGKEKGFREVCKAGRFPLPKGRYPILQFIHQDPKVRAIVQQQQQNINQKLEEEVEELQRQLKSKNVELRVLTNHHVDDFTDKLELAMRNHLKVVSETNHRKMEALREVQSDLREWIQKNQQFRQEESQKISEYVRRRAMLQKAIVQSKQQTQATKQLEINALHRLKQVITQKQQQQQQTYKQLHKQLHNVQV